MPSQGSAGSPPDTGSEHGRLETLAPLSNELIAAVLSNHGWKYFTDDDGDVGGFWDDNLIYFFRTGDHGEVLRIRTRARPVFPADQVARLHGFCNGWNHDRIWPKAYVHVTTDGARVYGEVVTDLERGVTIDQLDQLITCGIGSGCELATAALALGA